MFIPVKEGARTLNLAGGEAYLNTAKHSLAQYAMTGTLNGTFYASAEQHLETVTALAKACAPEFVAKTAVFCRHEGRMKELPAYLVALLAANREALPLVERIFPVVINDGKMLRLFVKHVRAGTGGRRSFGTAIRRLIRNWFEERTDEVLFRQSAGSQPTLGDIVRLTHPRPANAERAALYRYFIGVDYDRNLLPQVVQELEAYRLDPSVGVPAANLEFVMGIAKGVEDWKQIALRATFNQTRNNLANFARHGVFADAAVTETIVRRLASKEEVRRSGVFPYQLLNAYHAAQHDDVPTAVSEAVQDALEYALENVPTLPAGTVVCPDVSDSMKDPVTGNRRGASTAVRCVDVAALVAAAVLRKNPMTRVVPFEGRVVDIRLNPRDSVVTNAKVLASIRGGSTDCSAPIRLLNKEQARVGLVIIVSDNESWTRRSFASTPLAAEWARLKDRCPEARLALIDLTPGTTTQHLDHADVINIGGFSDAVFELLGEFAEGKLAPGAFVRQIEQLPL